MYLNQPARVCQGLFVYIVHVRAPKGYFLCIRVVMDFLPCIIKLQTCELGQFCFSGLRDRRGLLCKGACRTVCREHHGVVDNKKTTVVCLTGLQSCV